MKRKVSIIIPTKNSQNSLESCLKSIKAQTYKNIEIIVVDNHSSDKTIQIAKKYADKVLTKGPERSTQRNFGVYQSTGDYIAWFDSDMQLEKNVVKECVDLMNKSSAAIIPEKSIGSGFWAKCRSLEKSCYVGDDTIEGLRFIKKSVFKKVGMFSDDFISGEDWDVTIRVRKDGYKIARTKSYVFHDEGDLSLIKDLRKKYYYAKQSLPYVDRHIKAPSDVMTFIIRPAFLRNWRKLAQDPYHAAGMLFMKFCEFGIGLIGFAQARLGKK